MENHEREYAYGESDVRLLRPSPCRWGRAAERAAVRRDPAPAQGDRAAQRRAGVINSIQQGIAGKLTSRASSIWSATASRRCQTNTRDMSIMWCRPGRARTWDARCTSSSTVRLPEAGRSAASRMRGGRLPSVLIAGARTCSSTAPPRWLRAPCPGPTSRARRCSCRSSPAPRTGRHLDRETTSASIVSGDADVRLLLQTVASSMAVALQSAAVRPDAAPARGDRLTSAPAELAAINDAAGPGEQAEPSAATREPVGERAARAA